jgi:hypothetical protein
MESSIIIVLLNIDTFVFPRNVATKTERNGAAIPSKPKIITKAFLNTSRTKTTSAIRTKQVFKHEQ